jgi:NADH-quinone oxidoreductase subunit L
MDFNLAWAILLLPIFGFLILALAGKRLPKTVVGIVAIVPLVLSFLVSVGLTLHIASLDVPGRSIPAIVGPDWINILSLSVPFELIVDPLSLTMCLIVTGIGSLIFIYSTGYMAAEKDYSRFFTYLSLFVASMLILVLGNNLVLLFVGWEGVGLCSYLLIGFWYKDVANAKAANKAFIVNRIGDWGLSLGLFLLFAVLVSSNASVPDGRYFSYDTMLPAIQKALGANPGMANAIALLLFVGAAGKSAQFPLYFWLPDAMAGPTPVSALIHAATMVTSGVVLLNRMHVVFEYAPIASAIICGIGAFTAIFAALIAFGQTDIKKVLAFSTVSQLGYMFIACGAGEYWAGMFHVTTHAFFKALLFLGAGAVIHSMAHNQDMRNYGKLSKYLKVTMATMWIATLAISGVPGLSGYYSKEAILHAAFGSTQANVQGFQVGQIAGWIGLVTAGLTAWYMTRLMMLTFHGDKERWREIEAVHHDEGHHEPLAEASTALVPLDDPYDFYYTDLPAPVTEDHHDLDAHHTPHEAPASMLFPLVVLAVLSLAGGFLLGRDDTFEKWLYPSGLPVLHQSLEGAEKIPVTAIAIGAAVLGLVLGFVFYVKGLPAKEGWDMGKWSPFRRAAANQFGFDELATTAGVDGGRDLALGAWLGIETWVVDGAVRGLCWLAGAGGGVLGKLQSGYIRFYAVVFVSGVVCLLGYMAFAANQGVLR